MTQQPISETEADEAWAQGYKEGYKAAGIGNQNPPIPSRPGPYPTGVNPRDYYYEEGKKQGLRKGLHTKAGITTPE
ncbi:hypothetical protein [Niveispirillum fermenti]|uniref:hypothetical protein n=1 Tax=Niveispirillum fermenti TaxID=1233113 RepID=UPI003A8381DA